MIVTREQQVAALQDLGFLGQFVDPTSPSDAARTLGMPANLVHHHTKRHEALGLLVQVGRENGKVLYQLTARTFKHPRRLLTAGEPNHPVRARLARLLERFLHAYERSDRLARDEDPDWTVYGFAPEPRRRNVELDHEEGAREARPAHFQVRALRLSPRRYAELVNKVWRLLEEAASDEAEGGCTLAFLAMDGEPDLGEAGTHNLSSFVPKAW